MVDPGRAVAVPLQAAILSLNTLESPQYEVSLSRLDA